jgi:hypothetical protein
VGVAQPLLSSIRRPPSFIPRQLLQHLKPSETWHPSISSWSFLQLCCSSPAARAIQASMSPSGLTMHQRILMQTRFWLFDRAWRRSRSVKISLILRRILLYRRVGKMLSFSCQYNCSTIFLPESCSLLAVSALSPMMTAIHHRCHWLRLFVLNVTSTDSQLQS